MHHVLHLILAIFFLVYHTVIESVLLFSHSRLAKPTFKEGTRSKKAKRAHINKIHCFDGKENFAILEALKRLFWHFSAAPTVFCCLKTLLLNRRRTTFTLIQNRGSCTPVLSPALAAL